MIAATMIIINIVQAALIDHLNSVAWVTIFPGVVLIVSLLAIGLNVRLSWEKLKGEWREKPDENTRTF